MNQAQIRAFHAVAKEGGFSKAARRLGLTQPAITLQVKALETNYGIILFHRRGRQVILTDAGEQLLRLTDRMIALDGEANELLGAIGALQRGRLKVGADGPYHAIEILAAYRAHLPAVRVTVEIDNSNRLRQSLIDYACDVAVLAGRVDNDQFHHLPFRCHPLVLFVSRQHRFAGRRSVALADLRGQAMVLRESGSTTRRIFEKALQAAEVEVDIVLEIGSREGVHEAVVAGLGIGIVVASELGDDERIHTIEITEPSLVSSEFIVCLNERRTSPFVATFLDIAAELAHPKA